ncbi:hypothetical protein K435DRAFT_880233 [Dendrothele bispora CBS 962.96]|uniref:Uncharacterized protein n=1 Tax=Dendrothele bispora (strain CBS 962.96) TaxID=1314807 RepID=A0A4S8KKQ5_DENBC|nr:hypothetical protein K435DRAFT_880233 [Dendrothele bispora CBS 962.96]
MSDPLNHQQKLERRCEYYAKYVQPSLYHFYKLMAYRNADKIAAQRRKQASNINVRKLDEQKSRHNLAAAKYRASNKETLRWKEYHRRKRARGGMPSMQDLKRVRIRNRWWQIESARAKKAVIR